MVFCAIRVIRFKKTEVASQFSLSQISQMAQIYGWREGNG
jgi:hypothetical protein